MSSLYEGFSSDQLIVLSNGQEHTSGSVIETHQGERLLLVGDDRVTATIWGNAAMQDASGIVRVSPRLSYLSESDFLQNSELDPDTGLYTIPEFWWSLEVPEELVDAQIALQPREEATGFIHLHTHSEYSALDGLSTMEELVTRAKEMGHESLAITDHGVCAGHLSLQEEAEKQGIKPIFGMEAYLVSDRFSKEEREYHHLVLWALDDEGLRNLWAMSTEAYKDGFYYHPRLDYDTLRRFSGGVAAGSACLHGPLLHPYLRGNPNQALINLSNLMEIFEDRFYIEIHANQIPDQIKGNEWLVEQAKTFDVPMVAVVDSHYTHSHEQDDHQVWLSMQTAKDVSEESTLFGGGEKYHLMEEYEVRKQLAYLGEDVVNESIANTVKLSERCTARIKPRLEMPIYSWGEGEEAIAKDEARMMDIIQENWDERISGKDYTEEEAVARLEEEWDLLAPKRFMGYFLTVQDIVMYAKNNGVLVGPGRGSGTGSFLAYIIGITETDPLEHNLLLDRFMTPERTSLPDFDIDFPSSRKQFMIDYVEQRWGKSHVSSITTYTRLKNKSAFKDAGRAIQSRLPEDYFGDLENISNIIKAAEASTAGLGLPFDELMAQAGDLLEPFREKMPELFKIVEKFHGRLKTYGRHAAGLVIDTKHSLEGALPMMLAKDGVNMVTQFDKDELERLNYVKFDFLNIRNLDTLQETLDLINIKHNQKINVYRWREEYKDQAVYKDISDGWTLGMFQVSTSLGTRTVKNLKPQSIADVSDCITIGRPGPMRSGLDKTYLRRRFKQEKVTYPDPRLTEALSRTYGVLLYQEDIMSTCRILAQSSPDESSQVLKILGKKKVEQVAAAGVKFIKGAIANDTDKKVAEKIWADMAEFARYSFNRGHACAYAILAYWTAWFKHYYPAEFMVASMSTIDKEDIPAFVTETRRMGYEVLPPDINESGSGFSANNHTVRYGLDSVKGIGEAAMKAITEAQPFSSWDDFMERKGNCDIGQVRTLARLGAFDSLVPNRKGLEKKIEDLSTIKQTSKWCIFYQDQPQFFERFETKVELTCSYDWNEEPRILGKTGKPLKQKPLPAKCSRSCRGFTPKDDPDYDAITPYTDAEIREIEMEHLGVFLSSSPFDIIGDADMKELTTADALQELPNGRYLSAVMVMTEKRYTQKDGKTMKFLTCITPSGSMDITAFASILDDNPEIRVGRMGLVEINKNSRGYALNLFEAI